MKKFYKQLKWILPILMLILLAPFSKTIDLKVSNYFYQPLQGAFSSSPFYRFIYYWGTVPAFVVGAGSTLIFILSFFTPKLYRYRRVSFFLAFVMLWGPGILTQYGFKGFWGRPRPVHVMNFGGAIGFQPFYSPLLQFITPYKSFPSGHATMGFYFLSLIILGKRLESRALVRLGFLTTLALSFSLGIARIAVGAHFFSDVIMSGCLLWYVSLGSDWLIFDYLAENRFLQYTKK